MTLHARKIIKALESYLIQVRKELLNFLLILRITAQRLPHFLSDQQSYSVKGTCNNSPQHGIK